MLGAALAPIGVPSRYAVSGLAPMTPDEARLPVARTEELPAEALRLAAQAVELEANRRAPNTRRAYESDFDHFADWCSTMGLVPLPATPEAVYLYLCALVADDNAADYAITTLDRRLAASPTSTRPANTRCRRPSTSESGNSWPGSGGPTGDP